MDGTIEVDETYVGARKPGNRGRGAAGKVSVFGMAERKGDVKRLLPQSKERYALSYSQGTCTSKEHGIYG